MSVGAKGLAGLHKRAEELASQRQSFGLRKFTSEFRWDGSKPPTENSLNLRILGDDLLVSTKMHRGVPLPDNKFFFGVCRRAEPIESNFCYVCDVLNKEFDGDPKQRKRFGLLPTDVAVALAVEMETVFQGKQFIGYRPKMTEFQIPEVTESEKKDEATPDEKQYRALLSKLGEPGSKVSIPHIGMMVGTLTGQQALFDYATRRQSISDRVFEISRHGKGLETKWDWNHEGPDKDNPDPSELLKEYQEKYPFELPVEWALRNGSEDRYNFFFKLTPDTSGSVEVESSGGTEDDVEPVSNNRQALMDKLRGRGDS